MLTPDELAALEALLERARSSIQRPNTDAISPGDVVQLRPGADRAYECSLLLVTQATPYKIRGQILQPRRGGFRETWSSYSPAEVIRVGRMPYPEPARDILSMAYQPPCEGCVRKPPAREGATPATPHDAVAVYRDHQRALTSALFLDQIEILEEENAKPRKTNRRRSKSA